MGSGQPRAPYSIFRESEGVIEGETLRSEISNSRHVAIYLETKDQGIALLDLTARRWTRLAGSSDLDQRMLNFNEKLLSDARPFWSSSGGLPGLLLALLAIGAAVYGGYGELGNVKKLPDGTYELPNWTYPIGVIYLTIIALLSVAALVVNGIRLFAGGLRTWPRSLTLLSFLRAMLRLRDVMTVPDNVGKVFLAIITAVVTATLTWMLK